MIALSEVRQSVDIPGAQSDECLARLEFEIDLIADESSKAIHLFAVVSRHPHPAVHGPSRRRKFGARLERMERGVQGQRGHEQ